MKYSNSMIKILGLSFLPILSITIVYSTLKYLLLWHSKPENIQDIISWHIDFRGQIATFFLIWMFIFCLPTWLIVKMFIFKRLRFQIIYIVIIFILNIGLCLLEINYFSSNNELVAIKFGNISKIKRCDLKIITNQYSINELVLLSVSKEGNNEITKLLKNNGRNINYENNNGITPLYLASVYRRKDTIDLLINNGGDINRVNKKGFSTLGYIIKNNFYSLEIVKYLVENGASVKEKAIHEQSVTEYINKYYYTFPKELRTYIIETFNKKK